MDLLLEFRDSWGEVSNEGAVEEYKIGEKIMTDEDTGFGCQGFAETG